VPIAAFRSNLTGPEPGPVVWVGRVDGPAESLGGVVASTPLDDGEVIAVPVLALVGAVDSAPAESFPDVQPDATATVRHDAMIPFAAQPTPPDSPKSADKPKIADGADRGQAVKPTGDPVRRGPISCESVRPR
jgi:hypothetical protein